MPASPASSTPLCVADDATFWPWRRWPEFSQWPDPAGTLVILPVAGMADWGLGHGLDAEESVLMALLHSALNQRPPEPQRLLVLPPLRFVFGPSDACAFGIDPPTAYALLDELAESVALSGFRRIVLYNASPWNEELTAVAARDLRISRGLQMFRISLSGLGLDFDPRRSPDRRDLQTLVTHLTGREPRAGDIDNPADLATAATEAPARLEVAAAQLANLIAEIDRWPPLPDDGRIPAATPPNLA